MGVSGSGKSTVGKLLGKKLTLPFYDGDDYHPKINIEKMAAGHPLNDEDRQAWLVRLNELAKENSDAGAVIACSSLKKTYRKILVKGLENVVTWVFLKGSFEEVLARLRQRKDHFMPIELLRSQFETLEIPENAITLAINKTPAEMVQTLLDHLDGN